MWVELGKTASKERRVADEVLCRSCVRLKCDLDHQVLRAQAVSPTKKIQRQDPSSHARISYLSPHSRSIRMSKTSGKDRRKLRMFEHNEQDEQLTAVVSTISKEHSDELEKVFQEGEKHGVSSKLRGIWNLDAVNLKRIKLAMVRYSSTRICMRVETGKRSNKWSFVTIRIGN